MTEQVELKSGTKETPPEELLAKMIKDDLGVEVHPQAMRLWLRWRWDRAQVLAHRIHGSGGCNVSTAGNGRPGPRYPGDPYGQLPYGT